MVRTGAETATNVQDSPKGWHREWEDDPAWEVLPPWATTRCRRPRCGAMAVAQLRRRHYGTRLGWTWWAYCIDHLYGRRINGSRVEILQLVRNS